MPTPPASGGALLVTLLEQAIASNQPLTVLLTTGFTPLTDVLSARPDLRRGIAQVIWMGGAIYVDGNLDPTTISPVVANKHAEWNVFWDPFAAEFGISYLPAINVFPLDITNTAAITKPFMERLRVQGQQYSWSQLAYEAYDLVSDEPFYDMWDVTATCWLARPDLYTPPQQLTLDVVLWGFEQGWLRPVSVPPAGSLTHNAFLSFKNLDGFYDYVASQLARST